MAIINDLPVMSTPASGDELPIERGTTVYKIDYNALAAAIIAQQALTGVKGNAEGSYRTGNVNLTPANIGAVATGIIGSIYQNSVLPSGSASSVAGTLTVAVPAGSYLVIFGGHTQARNKTVYMHISETYAIWQKESLAVTLPDVSGAAFHCGEQSTFKTYNSATTITLTYSESWYFVYIMAIRLA